MNWFIQNYLKANPKKFQSMLISSHGCDVISSLIINVEDTIISSAEAIKVFGVKIDDKLNFTEHISDVCTKAGRQLNILQRHKTVLDYKSLLAIYKSFIMSNFNYCSIVWMFTCKKFLDRIENIKKTRLAFCVRRLRINVSWFVSPVWSLCNNDHDTTLIGNCLLPWLLNQERVFEGICCWPPENSEWAMS